MDNPGLVIRTLESIEADMAERQNVYEDVAEKWFAAKREREKARAIAFLNATGTVAERSAVADRDTALMGVEHEARFEALRAVMRTLEGRASIGQSILKAQTREGFGRNGAVQPQWSTGR